MTGIKGLVALLVICVILAASLVVSMKHAGQLQKDLENSAHDLQTITAERDAALASLDTCRGQLQKNSLEAQQQSEKSRLETEAALKRADDVLSQLPTQIAADRKDSKTPEQASGWLKALFQ